jgi:hypothetical protein
MSDVRFQVSGFRGGDEVTGSNYVDIAVLRGYITEKVYLEFRGRYKECIRMLNGLEKTLERKVPEREFRWQLAEESAVMA